MSKALQGYEFRTELLDFIHRRTRPFIELHKTLGTIVAGAYLQGMNDALDAIHYWEKKEEHHD